MTELGELSFPEHFYVFANQTRLDTRHNLSLTGTLFSAAYTYAGMGPEPRKAYMEGTLDYLPFVENTGSLPLRSPFTSRVIYAYRAEYDAEVYRRLRNPRLPSRLSAVFAFGDEVSCEAAASRYRWDLNEVRRFRLVPSPLNRVHQVNMEIASVAFTLYAGPTAIGPELSKHIWDEYWAGQVGSPIEGVSNGGQRQVYRPEPPIWEWLIEGILRLDEGKRAWE